MPDSVLSLVFQHKELFTGR